MTSTRSAKSLTNYYKMFFEFNWATLPDGTLGVTVDIPIKVNPRRDVWHYLGIVLANVEGDGSKVDETVK